MDVRTDNLVRVAAVVPLRRGHVMPRVLVLSSSGLVRFRVKRELKHRGFEVVEADGGEGFVNRAVRAQRPDVILIDTCGTGNSGELVVRGLKGDPTTSSTPVIMFSDETPESPWNRADIFRFGADGVATRRDDFDALAETLSLHLKR